MRDARHPHAFPTRRSSDLGTETVDARRHLLRMARFPIVARLGLAIARLTGLFRVFARAQERTIEAKNAAARSEEHTSELQSRLHLVCRLLLEKKNTPRECV